MNLSRRKALTLIGGGTVLAAGSAAGIFVNTRTPHSALAPWEAAGSYQDIRKWALSYALLAPNAHNRQPWQVGLEDSDKVVLWRDKSRELPETDPFQRQLVISLGCFLEQMRIAAAERRTDVQLDLYPEGEEGPVAVATFNGSVEPDPLFSSILSRRSCKEPFSDEALSEKAKDVLRNYAIIHSEPAMVQRIMALSWQAWLSELNHMPAYRESVELMRFGKAAINANPDGIDMGGAFLESLMLFGLLNREKQLDTSSTAYKEGINIYKQLINSGTAYAVINSTSNTRIDQIKAGQDWLRLNLACTELGVSLHPISQALQEYPAMAKHYKEAQKLLAENGETVQMLGRLGYGPTVARTPRWPLETRLI